MRKIEVSRTIEILANVGVVAGLVFLALEVRQNQSILEQQNLLTSLSVRESLFDNYSNLRHLLLSNPDLHQIVLKGNNGQTLEGFDKERYKTYCFEMTMASLTNYSRANALNYKPQAAISVSSFAKIITKSPELRECWGGLEDMVREMGFSNFANEVEQLTAK